MKDPCVYKFPEKLKEGIIVNKLNRFVVIVEIKGYTFKCYCPSTGRIGLVSLIGLPCLVSESDEETNRKTQYTLEAISYDKPSKKDKEWIGVNQTASNTYISYFIASGALSKMVIIQNKIERESYFSHSRLDIKADDTYIEIKTPLQIIEKKVPSHLVQELPTESSGKERLIKHLNDLAKHASDKQRSIILYCFQYIRDKDCDYYFDGGGKHNFKFRGSKEIEEAVETASNAGVESWTIELKITPKKVELVNYDIYRYDRT